MSSGTWLEKAIPDALINAVLELLQSEFQTDPENKLDWPHLHHIATSATPAPGCQSGQLFKLCTIQDWLPEHCSCYSVSLRFPLLNFVYLCLRHAALMFLLG